MRINYRIFRISKIFIFSAILFASFFIQSIANAQVKPITANQTNSAYVDLNTLFDLPNQPATLQFGKKADGSLGFSTDMNKATPLKDLIFQFDGEFDTNKHGAGWYWDKIADFDKPNTFELRVCDVGTDNKPIENTCVLSSVDRETDLLTDINTSISIPISFADFDVLRKDLKGKKFYHYDAKPLNNGANTTLSAERDGEISSFSVQYQPTKANKDLLPGKTYQADLWYCVAATDVNSFPSGDATKLAQIVKTVDNIRIFSNCDSTHLAYVRMAGMQFTVPANTQQLTDITAGGQTINQNSNVARSSSDDVLPQCAWFWGSGSFVGCLAKGVYYLIFRPIAWIAGLFGKLFDFFLGYSISDEAYRMEFAVKGWQIIRDISNIFFILILVYTGLMAVFDTTAVSMKKIVPQLILNALLINFSLFATRVVIDISNIGARLFYNVMDVRDKTTGEEKFLGDTGYKSVSEGIVATFNPQQVFRTEYLASGGDGVSSKDCHDAAADDADCIKQNSDNSSFGAQDVQDSIAASSLKDRSSQEYAGFFIVVSLLAALIMVTVITMFWKTSFFFLGRTVGLYIVMIFSPIAFLTRGGMPIVGNIKQIKWSDWVKELTNYATLAPIFTFFLYLVYLLMKSGFTKFTGATTFIEGVIGVAIPMLIVYFFLTYGVKIAENYAGFVGNMVQSKVAGVAGAVAGAAAGGAVGLASGGLGLIGRGLGSAANTVQNKTSLGGWINRTQSKNNFAGWVARRSNTALEKTKSASFDPRNSKFAMTQLQNVMPVKLQTDNKVLNALDLNSKKTQGGYAKYQERKNKEEKERIEKVETKYSDDDAKKFYADLIAREFEKKSGAAAGSAERITDEGMKIFKKEAADQLEAQKRSGAIAGYDAAKVEEVAKANKARWEAANADLIKSYKDFNRESQEKYGKVKDNKTLTQAMRLRYAQNIADDPTSPWNTIRVALGAGIPGLTGDTELNNNATKKAAEKYLKDTQKSFKSTQKAADELAAIDKSLNSILDKFITADPTKYGGYKNSKGEPDYNMMDVDARNEMLKQHRMNLESQLEAQDLELDELKRTYSNAKTSAAKKKAKEDYAAKAKEKATIKNELDEAKNILNRRDRAQEKVDGKGKDEKKEDKKPEGDKK